MAPLRSLYYIQKTIVEEVEDDYLEILEGTQSQPSLDVLKNLQNSNIEKSEDKNSLDNTKGFEQTQDLNKIENASKVVLLAFFHNLL